MMAAPRRYARLAALGLVSLLLHLAILGSFGRDVRPPILAETAPLPLALRLQAAAPAAPRPPVRDAPAPAVAPRLRSLSSHAADAATGTTAAPVIGAAQPLPRATLRPDATLDAGEDEAPPAMPGRYRFATPRSVTLDYILTQAGGAPPVPAHIRWQTDGSIYQLAVDGVTGPLASTGAIGDVGVAPAQASMPGAGGPVSVTFAPNAIVIGGQSYENILGSQDMASLLMQLTGMGLARPEQFGAMVALNVVTAEGSLVMQFRVSEDVELATPMGNFSTLHLVQRVAAGQARLELWLAPARDWLPLQLRLTAPDGSTRTQAITRIGPATALVPAS